MSNILEISNLSKHFGGLTAVSALDLSIGEGEILALIGPNGAGKSTVFNMVAGVYAPSEGEIRFLGSIRMRTATGGVLTGWLASQTDMLAEDWVVVM